ncbi:MAG TPA: DNA-processing protein DprA [Candidatus Angelobacter sp.]|nr:DNA-processing protein DprA [Candidatus Angelobacter sp.]
MMRSISPDTEAILLLTAPLMTGQMARDEAELLSAGEYRRVARQLKELQRSPSDLLGVEADQLARELSSVIPADRIRRLLERGFLISQAMERWQARSIWVVSRADSDYPPRLKLRLKDEAPAVLYGCGPMSVLNSGGLAVVGSRHADAASIEYAEQAGRQSATAKKAVISGGAPGIDRAAMRGALESGGKSVGVMADSLERAVLNRDNRNWLLEEQLILISPYDPGAGFNVGHAMQRNKVIYTLADAALVVNADYEKGGTWAGATEQLQRLKLVPVYVRSNGEMGRGLEELVKMGAQAWPDPSDTDEFLATLDRPVEERVTRQSEISFQSNAEETDSGIPQTPAEGQPKAESFVTKTAIDHATKNGAHSTQRPAELLLERVRDILVEVLVTPKKESEIAEMLQVSGAQMKLWLRKLVEEGILEKSSKRGCFVVARNRLV